MITLILLAAGLSERFGSPKALAQINGEIIIERLQRTILETSVGKMVVVLGAHAQNIQPHLFKHTKISSVYNKDYKFGQTSSVKTGVNALPKETKAFFMLPVDFPLVSPQAMNALMSAFKVHPQKIIIPTFQNRRGHPPLFDISFKEQIQNLSFDHGLNTVLHDNPSRIYEIPVNDPGVLKTFNTPEELRQII